MENIYIQRAKLIKECQTNLEAREAVKVLCKNDLEGLYYFIENFVWLQETRNDENFRMIEGTDVNVPMVLDGNFKYQRRIIKTIYEAITGGYDLRIEKSRDMGLSWILIILAVWGWLFKDWSSLFGSRKQDVVDKLGDMDALLPKARYLLKHLPKWMLPQGFILERDAKLLNIYNSEKEISITGESNNQSFGTGGRRKFIGFDEFAKWEGTDEAAWISAGANTPCRIALSTPFYKTNHYYVLKKSPIKTLEIDFFENPAKDPKTKIGKIWFDEESKRYSKAAWAQEYGRSYEGTKRDSVFFEELQYLRQEKRIAPYVVYSRGLPIITGMDFGMGALTSVPVFQILGWNEELRLIDLYENSNEEIAHYIDWLKNMDRPWNRDKEGKYINTVEHWEEITIVPDPNQGSNREMGSKKSLNSYLKDAGFTVKGNCWIGKKEGVSETKKIMKRMWINSNLVEAIEHFSGYHYKWNPILLDFESDPVHDIHSHFCKAVSYVAAYLKSPETIQKEEDRRKEWEEDESSPEDWGWSQ